jgi:hypothetical protein
MIRCEQTKLQTLSSFFSLRRLLALQKILHELTLVCRKTLTAAEEIEERVAVFDEDRPECFGSCGNCEWAGMRRVATARAMTE